MKELAEALVQIRGIKRHLRELTAELAPLVNLGNLKDLGLVLAELKRHNELLQAQVAGNVLAELQAGTILVPDGCKQVGQFRQELLERLFKPLRLGTYGEDSPGKDKV